MDQDFLPEMLTVIVRWLFVSGIHAVAWGMILVALFGWRNPAPLAPGQRGPWEAGR